MQIAVPNQCHQPWDSMSGDEQARLCHVCDKNVYNLSEMSESRARRLLDTADDLCVRYHYRPDGTIVSSGGHERPSRAPSRLAAGVAVGLGYTAAFAGLTAIADDGATEERVAAAEDEGPLVACGLILRLKPKKVVRDGDPGLRPAPVVDFEQETEDAVEALSLEKPVSVTARQLWLGLGSLALLLLTFGFWRLRPTPTPRR